MDDLSELTQSPVSHATQTQRLASDPTLSAFVSANAGSGKTKVLVDRVLRLLLGGTPPGKILCLTYTKAAAAHMAIKVFDRLAGWIGMTDDELSTELVKLEGKRPSPVRLAAARRLFAEAVETPGGLKIETIHAFCERLLHLVPFEANVPARFEVLDEAASEELIADARRVVLSTASASPELAAALETVSLEAAGDQFDAAIKSALQNRDFLLDLVTRPERLGEAIQALARALDLRPDDTVAAIEADMLDGGIPASEWDAFAAELEAGSTNDRKQAVLLRLASTTPVRHVRLGHYLQLFFTGDWKPKSKVATKSVSPVVAARLQDELGRLAIAEQRRRAARTLERTRAVLTLTAAIFTRVEAAKRARGALDFDDLIGKTRALLLDSAAASWVLHKLDAGVDHVLVDEAQDTNAEQWDILRALTAEFTAGAGARGTGRTVFAVGDPKQSIYGFQGADPRAFADSERHFKRAMGAAERPFEQVKLSVSFRSAPAVLAAVDMVFAVRQHFEGLGFDDAAEARPGTVHATSRLGHYGRVEIWPPVEPDREAEPDAWTSPVDLPDSTAAVVVLANRIARRVRALVDDGDGLGRRVPAGEVLVLVRKRGALFEAIIRALKSAGLNVAGADRLRLAEHIAVLDLIAAGRTALLPDDDLTLATVLKSPLIGWSDDDLIAAGAGRPNGQSFRAALEGRAASGHGDAASALETIATWERLAGTLTPFGFFATVLGPMGGRRALIARLGPEAGDAIDEFLTLALAHEQREAPSLALFLARFGDASHDVKRDMDAGRGEIRVMTVHGAKGLEADLVVLADGCRYDERLSPLLAVDVPGFDTAIPVWLPSTKQLPAALGSACQTARQRAREEHNRLLYVAMTRAREHLIVAPHLLKQPATPPPTCWYGMIDAALAASDGIRDIAIVDEAALQGDDVVRVLSSGHPVDGVAASAPGRDDPPIPAWLSTPAAPERAAAEALRPSTVAPVPVRRSGMAGDTGLAARREGILLHRLIELLADATPADRGPLAGRFLALHGRDLAKADRIALAADAMAMVGAPGLAPLFASAGRSEAAISGTVRLPDGRSIPVTGQIDRIAVSPETAVIADFKSSLAPGAAPPFAHIVQIALYAALVGQTLAGRPVRALLVYRSGPRVVEVTADMQADALQRLAQAPGIGA